MNDPVRSANDLPPSVVEALQQGRKIEAIKILRRERGLELKQAKDAVDAFAEAQPSLTRSARTPRSDSGMGRVLLVAALIAVVIIAYRLLIKT